MDAFLDSLIGRMVAGVVLGLLVWGALKLNDKYWGF